MVTITILSLDRKDDIARCIESLYRATDTESGFEVIIVDQNSNRETKDFLKSLCYPALKVTFLEKNIGCARGRKLAFSLARPDSEYIFQADNDIVFTDNWLEQLIDDLERHPGIGAMQARCISPTGVTLLNGGIIERYGLNREKSDNGYIAYFKDSGVPKHTQHNSQGLLCCDYLSGGATLFRRKLLEEVPYDENYLNGYEDYDISIRARKNGWRLACDYNAILIHNNRRFKDKGFWEKERNYVTTREDSKTLYDSLLNFIKNHKMNPIRSDGFDAVIRDEAGKPFSEYSDHELKRYFDRKVNKPACREETHALTATK